jgi:hypothetical protein
MMKYLTKEHAKLWQAIYGITKDPRVMDGNPRAQQKLADKVKTAGANGVLLIPGKRWRYRMAYIVGVAIVTWKLKSRSRKLTLRDGLTRVVRVD